ncbi:hypothetical protein [Paracoccus xiamenensis]|uniref:hypothetical protein n=1 Tax=Paracoccus xiamenensis TaxID=2714901 RepID=UPI0014093204|nr:hypothetical protein [Paracoccus xiamenensis]NHF71853.1 hypothetical protein [Paracoccus xiamenensis]
MNADTRSGIADPNDTPRFIIGSWLVRVAFMAVAIWLVNCAFGPFGWSWAALVAYAIMSLALNLAPSRLKDSQVDRIGHGYFQDDARHPR